MYQSVNSQTFFCVYYIKPPSESEEGKRREKCAGILTDAKFDLKNDNIKKVFNKWQVKYHPDKNPNRDYSSSV